MGSADRGLPAARMLCHRHPRRNRCADPYLAIFSPGKLPSISASRRRPVPGPTKNGAASRPNARCSVRLGAARRPGTPADSGSSDHGPALTCKPRLDGQLRRRSQPFQLRCLRAARPHWRKRPVCSSTTGAPEFDGGADLFFQWVDEQTHAQFRLVELRDGRVPSSARWPWASRPPSVVISCRFSGTRHTSSGRICSAMSRISGVLPISRLSLLCTVSRSRARSRSCKCRRSARKCTVMDLGPRPLADRRRRDEIRFDVVSLRRAGVARLPQRGDMVDVDAEGQRMG